MRADVGTAAGGAEVADHRAAAGAGLALAAVDLEAGAKPAHLAVDVAKIAEGRAARADRPAQDGLDGAQQDGGLGRGN